MVEPKDPPAPEGFEDLPPEEEPEEVFETKERKYWREVYQRETATYAEDFLAILKSPNLLDQIMQTWEQLGLVGIQNKLTSTLYCCLTKDLPKSDRIHNVWWGASRGGKNTPIEKVVKCFDPACVEAYTRVTETFIDHCPALTDGIIFYLNQFTQRNPTSSGKNYVMGDEILDLCLSEGDRSLGTVIHNKPKRVNLAGKPLFISTTNYKPRVTTASRVQLTHSDETFDQTKKIMHKKTEFHKTGERPPEHSAFLMQLTHWFRENCEKRVVIPWADILTKKLIAFAERNKALRWRDDTDRIFAYIKVDARVHQEQLPKTAEGAIIASPQQWMNVLKIIAEDLVAIMEELPPAAREIIKEIYNKYGANYNKDEPPEEFKRADIAKLVSYSGQTITNSMKIIRAKGLIGWNQEGERKPYYYWVLGNSVPVSTLGTEDLSWTLEELGKCSDHIVTQKLIEPIPTQNMHPVSYRVTIPDMPNLNTKPETERSSVPRLLKVTQESPVPKRPTERDIARAILQLLKEERRSHIVYLFVGRVQARVPGARPETVHEIISKLEQEGHIWRPPPGNSIAFVEGGT